MVSEIQRMLKLRQEIERLRVEYAPMPDDAMDALGDASWEISSAIINAPAESEPDLAAKFSHVAFMISEYDGECIDESEAVERACADLAKFRNEEWMRVMCPTPRQASN
ncbi:hypothetical protein [Sinorhizobium medicae]|uniref:hypothetical protein n=1 Tax=Sinorhizobium medicae TaxID=110321 RepID=UPI000429F30A|nr:hypothetical protein [Sinorhizobium medicae]RVQ66180.1 hypothetical protein CN244_20270 [Sinorhizobium medicae]